MTTGNLIIWYDTIINFSFFLVDTINNAIIHVFTDGNIEIYHTYSKEVPDYKDASFRTVINNAV